MAHPHPTPDVPGHWPRIHAEVLRCADPDGVSSRLADGLGPEWNRTHLVEGHVCATTWVFDPEGQYILLVRHDELGWTAPGGHIEPQETTWEGGLRELEEETGLTRFDVVAVLAHPALVHVSDRLGERPHRHWNVAWLFTADMDSPLSPVEGARWWPVTSVPESPAELRETMLRLLDLLRRNGT